MTNTPARPWVSRLAAGILAWVAAGGLPAAARAQMVWVVDQFNPSGTGGSSYSGGQITNVWGNWFGGAFQSLSWDSTSDAGNNPGSGSMQIIANFAGTSNQFEVYNGFNGIVPTLNGLLYTNFECDVRFAPGSATVTNGGVAIFGHLQFGVATATDGQDYFGGVDIPASNTNWVHVSLPINAVADPNLQAINDVLIHMYGPYYSPGLSGPSTLWVDNIAFAGPAPVTTNCVVNWTNVYQSIDGFGASSAWRSTWSTSLVELLYSTNDNIIYTDNLGHNTTNNGVGLSLLRSHIEYGSSPASNLVLTTAEISIMQMAQNLGARVWSTPWTPAAGFKSPAIVYGGSYLGSGANATNLAYASQLANYVANMKSYGINLYAISIQNEPDAQVTTYEACSWTAQQIHDFATNLYSALAAKSLASTKIILPESENWQDPSNLTVAAMTDPSVAADIGIVADHNYDGISGPATLAKNSYGKPLWETEVSLLSGSDSSINNGVYYAQRIYYFMTVAQVNAWHYWWLVSGINAGNQGLLDNNAATTKRLFTVGNYSRFVRPGFCRIGVSNNASTLISAYNNTNSTSFAIVAVNPNPITVTQVFNLYNFPPVASVTPWITSSNLSLAPQPAVSVANSSFAYALPALSVVTFAGQQQSNTAPVLTPVPNQTINAGVTLVLTNIATDTDSPPPTLTFGLLAGPTNSTLNASNGVFAWRPLVSQANTTNAVSVQVKENGTPVLTATNNFSVTVKPLTLPVLNSITMTGGRVALVINGPSGPDYTLLVSTNLASWQALLTSNSPALPLTLVDTNSATNAARFYRIQIGP
jgi:glucuronoarabinoxylan endo-1,4-beta-xylanase